MKKLIVVLLFLMALATSAYAAMEWPVDKHVFGNGMVLLTMEDHSTPSVSLEIWMHVGSKNERPGITGISHLFEHLMFMGTDKMGPEEYSKIIQKNGGICNAYTSYDMTVFQEDFGKDQLDQVLDMESDRLQHLKINEKNFLTERSVIVEERGFRVDNSQFSDVLEQLYANAWMAHPYQWMVTGWRADIQNLTLRQSQEYFKTYYNPANAVMVIVGDVKTPEVIKMVDKYYGKIPGNPDIPRPLYNEPEQRGERRVDFHKMSQLPIFIAGYHVPGEGHPDQYALDIMGRILSGGQSSRIYKRLVYDEQLALAAGGEYGPREQAGLFYAYAFMSPGRTTAEGEKAVYEEIDKMKTQKVTDEELQKAKNQVEAEFYMGIQSNESKAELLGRFQTFFGDYKLLFQQADKYAAVTADDIVRVAKTYLDPRNRTVITVIQDTKPAGTMGMKEE
ncbi:MAG: pitrilysin family protein [candidate division Zixibacteria bacterium]|jgi:zinc protease|nr:pitrilysin family protein [candidate division Zixibacteria bacterium]